MNLDLRHRPSEEGMALVAVMVVLMLVAGLLAGFTAIVMTERRVERSDRDRTQAFYAAHAGLEKATADLGLLFASDFSPSATQVNALLANPPAMANVSFPATTEGAGYAITFTPDTNGNPAATQRTVSTGSYAGLIGLVTPYTVSINARTTTGGEVRLQRSLETVSIPVFQFGIFSETDLGFHSGTAFSFGGRVHTNGNLFLSSDTGDTLTLSDKVTAAGEIVRKFMPNGWPTSSGWDGPVSMITAPGSYRNLAATEGSVVGTIGSAQNEPTWTNLSTGTYNGNIRNGRTGAHRLDLPLITVGSSPIEMIRRPAVGEASTSAIFTQRLFGKASLRILLSDAAANITSLPTVTATAPVQLGTALPAWFTPSSTKPPLAVSKTETGTINMTNAGSPLIGGYIKIEMQTNGNVWQDVTQEILNLGFGGANSSNTSCSDPSPNAVIRLQRVRDSPSTGGSCGTTATIAANDSWPLVLYDTREGNTRDSESTGTTNIHLGGAMYFVELDVNNFRRWLAGQIGTSGTNALNDNGFTVYFSDRRTNQNAAGQETGEYGNEDVVNPADVNGVPNGVLDAGEDVNGNGILDVYGRVGEAPVGERVGTWHTNNFPETLVAPNVAKVNPPLFFRRALKLTNGTAGNLPMPGLTVAAENPVYIEGNFNANSSGFGGTHAAASVIADAVTLLSTSWNDARSFVNPDNPPNRGASDTWYRVAVIAGKGLMFPYPSWNPSFRDMGSDGGVHNFLRYIEDWSNETSHYRGSLGSFYYSRQAVGIWKCTCQNVYFPPTRDYQFDTDFLTPSLLPPNTPMFRDINTLGFSQVFAVPR